ncbi:CHASE domain-containing protein [Roseovarius sp. CAU 1744]|uniref:CHASE domain-containing sensor histidine kinase n=1 Tax=Roseovarius sp. CAU 1744 TaxID=3140368 RepID=UPI00325A651B
MKVESTSPLNIGQISQIKPSVIELEKRSLERNSSLSIVHWLVVLLSLILTIAAWQFSRAQIALRTEARFEHMSNQIAELIEERLQKYELALWSGVAALKSHKDDVGHLTWRAFAKSLDIEHRYPGVNGIGVIHQVKSADLESYLQKQRRFRPEFNIHPPHDGEIYQPITFIEPIEKNSPALGLDMVHEVNRHSSINRSRDTNSAQMSGPIILVQGHRQGFLFFAPYYTGENHVTLQARRENFAGAVYAPIIVEELIQGVLHRDRRSIAIRISDKNETIYDEIESTDSDYDTAALGEMRIAMQLYGREWNLELRSGLEFRAENSSREPLVILMVGILIDLALLSLFYILSRANRRGLQFVSMATNALEAETQARRALNAKSQALMKSNQQLNVARLEAESASKVKSAFLSTMSHEVRTPLTAISGILVLLERADLSEQQNKLVHAGKLASEKLIKLLTDILESSRLEAGAVELFEREVAVKPLVEEWRVLAEGAIQNYQKAIEVVVQISSDTPSKIVVDDVRLSQVMNNLLDNAVRFTENGQITIKVIVRKNNTDLDSTVIITLQDTGIGIADSDLEVIFDRFRQVDNSMTRSKGGSGLGLAICEDVINLMGGKLNVSSKLGEGTIFEICLPVKGAGDNKLNCNGDTLI